MENTVRPDEAAQALTEIGHRQAQVIELTLVPRWFWWTTAALMVGFAAAVDSRVPLAIAIGTAVFALGVAATTGWVVISAARQARVRNGLVSPLGVLAILGFVAIILAVSLPTSFALEAAGVRYAATIGVCIGAVGMVAGEPLLTRTLKRLMLANRVGARS
jgi:hypothetical protein